MTKKRGTPAWLVASLALLLGILVLILVITPEQQPIEPPGRIALPTTPLEMPAQRAPSKATRSKQPPAKQPAEHQAERTAPVTPPSEGPGLALIIDDVGYNMRALRRILALSIPVAISILPDAPHAVQAARLAHQAGQVVMLHLPMQPEDPSLKMSSAFLIDSMSDTEIQATMRHNLAQVPYVEGVNNHMGSRLTQSERAMRPVMSVCRHKGLFFVDSRTSPNSVAAKAASHAGVRWASRQIFLDHMMTEEAMTASWNRARRCMRKKKRCIIIAHPRADSVDFLERHLSKEDAASMVEIKQLLRPAAALMQTADEPLKGGES